MVSVVVHGKCAFCNEQNVSYECTCGYCQDGESLGACADCVLTRLTETLGWSLNEGTRVPWMLFSGRVFTGRETTPMTFMRLPIFCARCMSYTNGTRCHGQVLFIIVPNSDNILIMQHINSSHAAACRLASADYHFMSRAVLSNIE